MNEKFIPFGFQYYRAPTPLEKDWEKDFKKLSQDGYNTVKLWVSWRYNEPKEDLFDFTDLDKLMDLALKYDLKVILNIILDQTPSWFMKKYPDSEMVLNSGKHFAGYATEYRQLGGVPGPCFHHKIAKERKEKFVRKCAQHFKDCKALYMWDVWNEPELSVGVYRKPKVDEMLCYCDNSIQAFKLWLEKKYKTIDNLNNIWGRRYNNFDEVELPRRRGTTYDWIDFRMFFTETITLDVRKRVEDIKMFDKEHEVMCHTVPIPYFNIVSCCSDDFSIANEIDVVGNSIGSNPLAADLLKSAAKGKRMINSEIHTAYGSSLHGFKIPTQSDLVKHIFIPLFHGSKGFVFWQYRPEILGNESPAWGHVKLDGSETEWNTITKQIKNELFAKQNLINKFVPKSHECGIYYDKENEVYTWGATGTTDLATKSLTGAYELLYRSSCNIDFITSEDFNFETIKDYKFIYFPSVFVFDKNKTETLKKFVEKGGTVLIEALFGSINKDTGKHDYHIPGCGLSELLKKDMKHIVSTDFIENGYDGIIHNNSEIIHANYHQNPINLSKFIIKYDYFDQDMNKEVIAKFDDGSDAISIYKIGKGRIIDVASLMSYAYSLTRDINSVNFIKGILNLRPSNENLRIEKMLDEKNHGFVLIENFSNSEEEYNPGVLFQKLFGNGTLKDGKVFIQKNSTIVLVI